MANWIYNGKAYILRRLFPPCIERVLSRRGGAGGGTMDALISADGYTLSDVNGVYLIPKEDE